MLVVILDLLAEGYFVALNWVNPPATAFMLKGRYLDGDGPFLNDTVDIKYISRYLLAATLVHEDSRLGTRFEGLNWDELWARAVAHEANEDDPYGSPIPEQLSKNLLLVPWQNPIRKAADAVLAEQLIHATSPKRVLELYLNVAQFGPGLYGVCDATWYYFGSAPDDLTWEQAEKLMGLLPGPIHAHRAPGGGIDTNPATKDGKYTLGKVNGALMHVPQELNNNAHGTAGWLAPVRDMGITDNASDQPDGPGSCRTMPEGVRARIAAEARR